MFEPKLGVSLAVLSGSVTDELLQAVGESRIETLEISPTLFDGEAGEGGRSLLREALGRGQVRAMSVHARFGGAYDFSVADEPARRAAIARALESVELAGELDAPLVVVHASAEPIDPPQRPARLAQARRALAEIGACCRRAGRRVAVELLPRTGLGNTVAELADLIDPLEEGTFGVCLDTNHLMARHRDLAENVRRLGERLIALHLSDYDGVDEKHELPGKGVLDWRAFMQALCDIHYAGPFNYECKPDGETLGERIRSLEDNFDWLCGLA